MVMTNKDIADFNKQLDKIKQEKGPNDLEKRIEDLLAINKKHQLQNSDLIKDNLFYKKKLEHYQIMSTQLKKELDELKQKTVGLLTEFRNKGDV
mgnify:FL=1|tara:strand:+ start:127 stop:408 length:282 start_codon:yes stop_codon:yes gene_type:complete